MKKRYEWRRGRHSLDPATAYAELERIRKERGSLTASALVEEALPEDSPLHGEFEWDDAIAGAEHRLTQARQLIRAIVVRVDRQPPKSTYVNVRVAPAEEGTYEPLQGLHRRPDAFALALAEAHRSLTSAQRRVDELEDMARSSDQPRDTVATLMLAIEALGTAKVALSRLS